jgi:DNA-binding NarL/FixJ family response regulator
VADVQGLIDAFNLDDAMCTYLDERWQKFNSEAIARAERMAREQRESASQALRAINVDGTASEAIAVLQTNLADVTSSRETIGHAIAVLAPHAELDTAIVVRGIESVTCRAVTVLVTQGLSNAEIAERLTIDVATVEHLLGAIYQQLQVTSRAQLIVWCLPHLGAMAPAPQATAHNGEVA